MKTWTPSPELLAAIQKAKACHDAYLELNLTAARDAADKLSPMTYKARALAAESWSLDAAAEAMFRREALGRP